MKAIPDDPYHPFYYHVFSETLPSELAYRVIDIKKDIAT